jgi:hypothetical protein
MFGEVSNLGKEGKLTYTICTSRDTAVSGFHIKNNIKDFITTVDGKFHRI